MRFFTRVLFILLFTPVLAWLFQINMVEGAYAKPIGNTLFLSPPDSTNTDTTNRVQLRYPFTGDNNLLYLGGQDRSNFYLQDPKNLSQEIVYDPITNQYIVTNKLGDLNYRPPQRLSMEEYREYDEQQALRDYWVERSAASATGTQGGIIPQIHIGGKVFDRIFGGNTIDIRPQGSAELIFGVVNNKREDPALNVRQQSVTNFDFQEKIQLNVLAKIGDKIEFKVNYNTESTFDFENKLKLKYEGDEDEIIKLIEAGDVTLPLSSTLIQGSQSLFGIKTKLQFGKLTITSVFSQQKSETSSLTVQGGGQKNDFELRIDQYEENKHFFLAEYFRDNYELALADLPLVASNVSISKVEVWVTNIGAPTTDNRNILAMQDLGEHDPDNGVFLPKAGGLFPDDQSNDLRQKVDTNIIRDISAITNYLQAPPLNLVSGLDYEKVELARKLRPSEFSYNSILGFISLNTRLNPDQVLAVSYQYRMRGEDRVYQVGEFSDDGIIAPNTLMVKLLKSTSVNTSTLMWDLMMKNIYNIGAYQVNREDFILNILFTGGEDGVPKGYLPKGNEDIKGVPLIEVMNFDNLDQQSNPYPDGVFDFVDNAAINGGTIQSSNGRIFFTMLEPFGEYLREKLDNGPLADEYCYDSLYRLTKSEAQQYPAKNKYLLEGSYKSSSGSEISLNALNVPQGSVRVTAGGIQLTENVDYTVDYTLGRVRIINEGILNSGTPINISMESNSAFNLQTKRMMGAHFDYEVNQNLHLGGTILNLSEKPITQKTNIGDDPINNTIWGVDMSYQKESRWITKMVDKLPLIETNARSMITLDGEFAHFLPGHSRAIGTSGTSYIDDFEGTKSTIDLKMVSRWVMASTPQGQVQPGMFPEAGLSTGLVYGMNRAKFAWYIIDPLFYDQGNLRPKNITSQELSDDDVRQILEKEVFPNKETPNGYPTNIPVFNLAYYPDQKGPYNYDVEPSTFTAGIDESGDLLDPESRWGGIMREIETSDFEATNVEYIEFWMMDPFGDNEVSTGGDLYFNLGDISEDILRDSRKSFENGLPTSELVEGVDETIWGRVPALQSLVDAFDNQPESRLFQDVGFDGLRTVDERSFFQDQYLKLIADKYGTASKAYTNAIDDPSGDNFHYFRGTDYDNDDTYKSILERYKRYNGPDGNSPVSQNTTETYSTVGTTRPDVEDINRDNTLSESERYFQYKITLHPDDMEVGKGYITDMREGDGRLTKENGDGVYTKWYQFKIPINRPNKVVGNISDFKSIRFMRMFMKSFKEETVLRFATLELVRSDWRKYEFSLLSPGEFIPNDEQSGTIFETAAINIEENGSRTPIPYVLPPGIEREINVGTTNLQRQNEQAMQIYTCGLVDGDARAVFKTTDFDFRRYKRLKMFVHAEKAYADDNLEDGDLTLFLRMGSDFTNNYYEYEVPLHLTDWGTSDPDAIWPASNSLDVELEKLVDVKLNRNIAEREDLDDVSFLLPYSEMDGENRITVLGSPSLSEVRAIMIGIRNPKKQSFNDTEDDGLAKCAEVWVNELRVTDFDNKSAWAATARVKIDLADFGNVIVSGTRSTAGFGGLESKINDRQKEDITNFDIATNLRLGKLFPEEWGVKVPMHFDYSESRLTPEYNPLDPDINFDKDLDSYATKSQKDSVKALSQDLTIRKNINFINVRKDRTGQSITKQHFYDIENFDVSYSYSEVFHRNIDIQYHLKQTYRGGLGYNLALNPKPVTPLKKVKWLRKKSFRIIRDFNFYYMPKLFSFRMDVNREYTEKLMRNKSKGDVPMRWTWSKTFDWNRTYNLKYDITKGLKLEYSAQANAYVDEPQGRIGGSDGKTDLNLYRDSVWMSIFSGGSMNQFDQSVALNYSIPINKIPIFDWVTANARYQGDYHWTASPSSLQERMGNTIENSNTISLNGNLRMEKLYNKVPYLKKLNRGSRSRGKGNKGSARRGSTGSKDKKVADSTKKDLKIAKAIMDNTLKFLMMWKDGSITYSQSKGNLTPGFSPQPGALGNNWTDMAPGIGYIFGWENDITRYSNHTDWLSTDSLVKSNFNKYTTNLNVRATLEPIKHLRIELTATRTYSYTRERDYLYDDELGGFQESNLKEMGSFSMSFFTFGTAFDPIDKDNNTKAYNSMKDNRLIMANRLARENPYYDGSIIDSTGFPTGYSASSQDVLHGAFVAAYSNRSVETIPLTYFPTIPFPNWRVTYKGLSKVPALRKIFKNVTLTHSYRSSYSIGSYVSNDNFEDFRDIGKPSSFDLNGDFDNKYKMTLLSISEQFSPLIKLDMTWNNSLLTNFEYKKSRNLSLSFVNNQLTEVSSNEYVIGVGYRIKNVKFSIKTLGSKGKKKQMDSDINVKVDFSVRDNKTVLRRLDEEIDQISSGQRITSLNFSADYMVSQKFTIRLYFDRIMNKPHVANQYPNSTTSGGISLRFTLTQ